MKKLLFFLLVFSFKLSFSQFSTMFNDTLRPFGSGAYGFQCAVSDSNFYYIMGIHNSTIGQYAFITKTDKNGIVINNKVYIDTSSSYAPYPYNSMVLQDSIIVFCGQKWNNNIGTLGTIFAIDKQNLDTLWTKTYAHPDTLIAQTANDVFSVLTAIKSTSDGGYILTGNYNKNCITGNLRSFLMKIDGVGNVQWRRVYNFYYTFFDIEVAADSGYFVPSGFNGTNALQLVKFDENGIYEWKVGVTTNNMAGYPIELKLIGTNYAILGYKYLYDVSNFYTAVSVSKVDLNTKSMLWEKVYYTYKSFDCITLHQAMGVETLPNGDIIVSGTANRYGHDAVILKLNSNGDSLWCKSYDYHPDNWDCQLNDLILTDDGGFLGVGFFSDHNTGWTAWMFKTDANGVVGWDTSTPLSTHGGKLYPNPARDYTNLVFESSLKADAELKLYNALGALVIQKRLSKGQKRFYLDLQGFGAGVYFYEVLGSEGAIATGKFVKE